ncbi:sialidase family protein [Chitinophaga sp. 212800010-3]|uniref:sialidase family protein n=1 Tax=unclassified Chitinophaga TaxID=2619133 RepID=UPI002DE70545|nr:Exo-alpha-sialidase [Chitinophaga sp. 212800010-3]
MKWIPFILLVLISACGKGRVEMGNELVLSHAEMEASCPYLTKDTSGKPVVCWVEKAKNGNTGYVYYSVSNDNGYTFSDPVQIAASAGVYPHDENLPKMLFMPGGRVVAMFGIEANDPRNKYAGKVMYTLSGDNGKTWQPAVSLVTDTAGYDQRYFDLALLPGGEAAAIWLDNRKDTNAEGSTLYFSTTRSGSGFREARPVAATTCQCCRTKLYVSADGNVHLAYRDIINDSIRDMVHQVSTDEGKTFSAPVRISADNWVVNGCPHTGPAMTANSKGLHFAWFTMGGGQGAFYCRSTDNGKTYTQKESLGKSPMARHPQMTTTGDEVMITWDEPVKWKNDFNSRIGFQYKSAEGKTINTGYLTADSTYANFPVVNALNPEAVLVAYKKRTPKGSEVVVRMLRLN